MQAPAAYRAGVVITATRSPAPAWPSNFTSVGSGHGGAAVPVRPFHQRCTRRPRHSVAGGDVSSFQHALAMHAARAVSRSVYDHAARWACGRCWRPDARSALEHRPADVVPQPLVVEDELANRLRELVALPPALESRGDAVAVALRRRGHVRP